MNVGGFRGALEVFAFGWLDLKILCSKREARLIKVEENRLNRYSIYKSMKGNTKHSVRNH